MRSMIRKVLISLALMLPVTAVFGQVTHPQFCPLLTALTVLGFTPNLLARTSLFSKELFISLTCSNVSSEKPLSSPRWES